MTASAKPSPPTFSVIVTSRQRPSWLTHCMSSLRQQQYPSFELIVVSDPAGLGAIDTSGIKIVRFDEANLALARNLGIARSAGEICAFIDDDAVAEPLWLHRLAEAFALTSADAVVGFVRGRNGISFQSRLSSVDEEAETHAEECKRCEPFVPDEITGRAVKLVGTNMAIRRGFLRKVGGFDEAYRFFLEDADLSLRIAQTGGRIAVAPMAQVHHRNAPSVRRATLRVPLDLHEIGRSTAHYLTQHLGDVGHELQIRMKKRERARLIRHMVAGTCEPRDIERRMATLQRGWSEGLKLERTVRASWPRIESFEMFASRPRRHHVLSSRWLSMRAHLSGKAQHLAETGELASVFSFSLTTVRHRVRYMKSGYWLQTGGVFGRSERSGPMVRWCRFADRLEDEIRRVANERGIGDNNLVSWWDQSRF